MNVRRTLVTPSPSLAESWWPLQDVATTASRWYADHVASGWWDAGDMPRSRLRQATALVDELLASLPQTALRPDACVLELGCGPGTGLQELATRWPCRLHAWDPSPDARASASVLAPEATVHETPAVPLGLADGSVDVVWAPRCFARGGVDWPVLLAEAHRVLAPGGLLAAVVAGPGAWAWHGAPGEAWDEERTGVLVLGLDTRDEHGGPVCFMSAWWLRDHWGRGFDAVQLRPAGVTMTHPDDGFGLAVWRRREGPACAADAFSAVAPGDVREGRAFQRQLELAHREAVGLASRRAAAEADLAARAAALTEPDAVEEHPHVRAARHAVALLEQQLAGAEGTRR